VSSIIAATDRVEVEQGLGKAGFAAASAILECICAVVIVRRIRRQRGEDRREEKGRQTSILSLKVQLPLPFCSRTFLAD
jgi:hypothetical protein